MNKKVISSVLAGAMAISTLGMTAFAADPEANTDTGNNALSAKASLMEAKIKAIIPSSLEASINPYGAAVTAEDTTAVVTGIRYADGLVSPTYKIQNLDTDAGLKVTTTAKITPSATVAVNTKALDDVKLQKATEKQVFAFLNTTTDQSATDKPIFADTKYVGNEQQVVFTEDGTKAAGIMSIDKGKADGTIAGYFYVGGQCTPNPETAWDSKDTVTLDLILDLSPIAGAPADLSLASITLDSTATPNANIEKEFDGTKKVYEVVAKGSLTKAKSIKVTANFVGEAGTPGVAGASVYVKYNGKLFTTTSATATAKQPGITITAGAAGTAGNVVITPALTAKNATTGAAEAGDYNVGDKLEFIVVDSVTNESTTYVINFT